MVYWGFTGGLLGVYWGFYWCIKRYTGVPVDRLVVNALSV